MDLLSSLLELISLKIAKLCFYHVSPDTANSVFWILAYNFYFEEILDFFF